MNPSFVMPLVFMVKDSFKAERHFHDLFQQKRIDGEWFRLDYEDIRRIVFSMPNLDYCAPDVYPGTIEDYGDFEIEEMIRCEFSGEDYDDLMIERKIKSKIWECPACSEFCDAQCEAWTSGWIYTSSRRRRELANQKQGRK
jgi:hypothetical protein